MDRFARQERIEGWDQTRLSAASVAVYGGDWLGALTVWGLVSLGVGHVVWLGSLRPSIEPLARWLLADPPPVSGAVVRHYSTDLEYGPELGWALEQPVSALVCCAENSFGHSVCQDFAEEREVRYLAGTTARGGWLGYASPPELAPSGQEPVAAMALAALLVDSIRELICPLPSGMMPPAGWLELAVPLLSRPGTAVLVGAGGIGVYAATLAVALGFELRIFDCDRVDISNLNRQCLYTSEEAHAGVNKAVAARDALQRLFPGARVSATPRRVEADSATALGRLRPTVLLSAVDNARTRLTLQDLGHDLGIPVVQGGTATFSADCYVQEVDGPPLDAQMHGALATAASREATPPRRGGCAADASYVAPGMIAGALMAFRMAQLGAPETDLTPIHWRSGCLPVQERSLIDGFDTQRLSGEFR